MNELITISSNDGKQVVYARELYVGLGLNKSQWSRWFKTNILENDYFKENVDWVGVRHYVEGNETQDFIITLDFGKHIAMMAKTEKSHEYRNYFIEVERRAKQLDTSQLSPELQMFNQMFNALANQEVKTKQLENKVDGISDLISMDSKDWRAEAVNILRKIAAKQGGNTQYKEVASESYVRLEHKARCNLNTRLENRRKNMIAQGLGRTAVRKLNRLDIIQEDHRLKEIYMQVIKDMAIKYDVWEVA